MSLDKLLASRFIKRNLICGQSQQKIIKYKTFLSATFMILLASWILRWAKAWGKATTFQSRECIRRSMVVLTKDLRVQYDPSRYHIVLFRHTEVWKAISFFFFYSKLKTRVNSNYQSKRSIRTSDLTISSCGNDFLMHFFGKEKNGFRDRSEKSAGFGILVKKKRECGIKTPPSTPWGISPLWNHWFPLFKQPSVP